MLNGRTFSGASLGSLRLENAAWVVLACWAVVLLVFATLPAGSTGRMLTVASTSWVAEAFTGVTLVVAFLRSAGATDRIFWALFGGAVLARYVGDLVWTGSRFFGVDLLPTQQAVADAISYSLFFGVLFWLVKRGRQEMTPVDILDTVSVMLSSGLLLWFFVLDPMTIPADLDEWEASTTLVQPACDLGLFLLALGTLLTVRSPFAAYLTSGLLLLLLADGAYLLELRTSGTYVVGGWPLLFWIGGVALLGVAALHRGSAELLARGELRRGNNLRTFLFWLGPLSPPLQYGALLLWGMFHPSLPGYILLCGTVLLGIFAVRAYATAYAEGLLADKQEKLAVREEQSRISEELHDTLKQNVHGIPLMLETYREARKRGDSDAAEEILDRAIETAREASYRVPRPLGELRARRGDPDLNPVLVMGQLLRDIRRGFAIEVHEDFNAPLDELTPEELAAAYRIASEALWNAAKHAEAKNIWIESRKAGSVLLIEVCDDGCGFSKESLSVGLGLSLMRSRAERVGAELRLISEAGKGTTVQLRFDKR